MKTQTRSFQTWKFNLTNRFLKVRGLKLIGMVSNVSRWSIVKLERFTKNIVLPRVVQKTGNSKSFENSQAFWSNTSYSFQFQYFFSNQLNYLHLNKVYSIEQKYSIKFSNQFIVLISIIAHCHVFLSHSKLKSLKRKHNVTFKHTFIF